jgi:hypothetical protein
MYLFLNPAYLYNLTDKITIILNGSYQFVLYNPEAKIREYSLRNAYYNMKSSYFERYSPYGIFPSYSIYGPDSTFVYYSRRGAGGELTTNYEFSHEFAISNTLIYYIENNLDFYIRLYANKMEIQMKHDNISLDWNIGTNIYFRYIIMKEYNN